MSPTRKRWKGIQTDASILTLRIGNGSSRANRTAREQVFQCEPGQAAILAAINMSAQQYVCTATHCTSVPYSHNSVLRRTQGRWRVRSRCSRCAGPCHCTPSSTAPHFLHSALAAGAMLQSATARATAPLVSCRAGMAAVAIHHHEYQNINRRFIPI